MISFDSRPRRRGLFRSLPALVLATWLPGALLVAGSCQAQTSSTITDLNEPFQFTYGGWQDKAKTEKGYAVLQDITPQGGGGANFEAKDLTKYAQWSPGVRVRVGAKNAMKQLRVQLLDKKGNTSAFVFTLPASGNDYVTVAPKDGAPLSKPNEAGKDGKADLSQIVQWQLQGDWSGDKPTVDLSVDAIVLVEPDAAINLARVAMARQEAADKERLQNEQKALQERYGKRTDASPTVTNISLVGPDMLAITIHSGKIIPGKVIKYVAEPGDERRTEQFSDVLLRKGQEVGRLIGVKKDYLSVNEGFTGDPLLTFLAEDKKQYTIQSADDDAYKTAVAPLNVYRKGKPSDWQMTARENFEVEHHVFLKLPKPLTAGKQYTIGFGDVNVRVPQTAFTFDPLKNRSDAVHVDLIGFRPDDPLKRGFVSVWLGNGGNLTLPTGLGFRVVEDATGKTVYTGKLGEPWAADKPEKMQRAENFNKTTVYPFDFSDVKTPGKYRVVVDGIGSSYPFPIASNVWEKAFITQMKGFLNNRSGVALGPPYTSFVKPRDFHPADPDVKVFESTYNALEKGGEAFPELEKGSTGKPVPDAWGGWHDAGDWNPRRITHMKACMAQMEILDLFPETIGKLNWGLPKVAKVPDVFAEALFELDCFRRLQKPDGGVPYGIETPGDPRPGEVSWKQTMTAYVYAPDVWSSYIYAEVAARAARLLKAYDPKLSATYQTTALKAMAWAEADRAKQKTAGTWDKIRWEVKDDRNLAALELYRLTEDKKWDAIFREDSQLMLEKPYLFWWGKGVQRDAAFTYTLLPEKLSDPILRKKAIEATEAEGKAALGYGDNNAWGITASDNGRPMFAGYFSTAMGGTELVRAHYVTKKPEYLVGAVRANLFCSGANPSNMTYTTGLGANPVKHPLHLDSRLTGQPAPEGLTVFGNYDFVGMGMQQSAVWPITAARVGANTYPDAFSWPLTENFYDIHLFVMLDEFVVEMWSPNVYVWGYLAARK